MTSACDRGAAALRPLPRRRGAWLLSWAPLSWGPPSWGRTGLRRRAAVLALLLAPCLGAPPVLAQDDGGQAAQPPRAPMQPHVVHLGATSGGRAAAQASDERSGVVLQVADARPLARLFERLDYSYRDVGADGPPVPRVFVAALPRDMESIGTAAVRERIFLETLLPLVLRVDEGIARDRVRLLALRNWLAAGNAATDADRRWLGRLAAGYELDAPDLDGVDDADAVAAAFDPLLARVDIVPPSMALAQAAIETGMGTSNLARSHNALFGQVGSGSGTGYASFGRLQDSVAAYVGNLNTHPAYEPFRDLRARHRLMGEPLDGYALMEGLDAYSVRRDAYIADIRQFIETRGLQALDRARLAPPSSQAVGRSVL